MFLDINLSCLSKHLSQAQFDEVKASVLAVQERLNAKSGAGNDFLGWLNPQEIVNPNQMEQIRSCAKRLRKISEVVLVVGIGGSYLGAKAAIDYLLSPLYNSFKSSKPQILFIGNDFSASHMDDILNLCEGKEVSLIVISKSGATTETAISFRILREYMEARYGEASKDRIVAITDKENGALKAIASKEGYETFAIPSSVGGRYSVITPVGLLPIAVGGIDIDEFMNGVMSAAEQLKAPNFEENQALKYAAARYLLYSKGYSVELFCAWEPALAMTNEWLKQLFGESEGKSQKGLFPSSAVYSTDLHSLGQFVQQGSPILFETVISTMQEDVGLTVPQRDDNDDNLNYLAGKSLHEICQTAQKAVCKAHFDGGVPIINLCFDKKSPFTYGWMLYFFMYSCALGGYLLGVNPFDQPGVENYKSNMFAMLGKPGCDK